MRLSDLRLPPGYRVTVAIGEASEEEQKQNEEVRALEPQAAIVLSDWMRIRVERDGQVVAIFSLERKNVDDVADEIHFLLQQLTRPRLVE